MPSIAIHRFAAGGKRIKAQLELLLLGMGGEDFRRDPFNGRWYNVRSPSLSWGDVPSSVAPYVPSPLEVVRKMLKLAEAGEDDVVYDLGCGDGRILFTAVEEFGVKRAVGFDLNAGLCDGVRAKVLARGLEGSIEVVHGNFFLADLSQATLVTLYLTTSGNSKLRPKLEKELGAGARVVSHDFPIHRWDPDIAGPQDHYTLGSHKIYLYGIPEAYTKEKEPQRTPEEASRWKRIRSLFLGLEREHSTE